MPSAVTLVSQISNTHSGLLICKATTHEPDTYDAMHLPAYLVQSLRLQLHCQAPSRLEKQLLPLILAQPNRSLVVEVSSLAILFVSSKDKGV